MKPLTRGEVAKRTGIGIETVRFYEQKGLIPDPPRGDSGYRHYPANVVSRIRFIARSKELGFSLKEISELLSLRVDPTTTCADVRKRAEAKLADTQEKIRDLQEIERALVKLTKACRGEGPTNECPILEALDAPEGSAFHG